MIIQADVKLPDEVNEPIDAQIIPWRYHRDDHITLQLRLYLIEDVRGPAYDLAVGVAYQNTMPVTFDIVNV